MNNVIVALYLTPVAVTICVAVAAYVGLRLMPKPATQTAQSRMTTRDPPKRWREARKLNRLQPSAEFSGRLDDHEFSDRV